MIKVHLGFVGGDGNPPLYLRRSAQAVQRPLDLAGSTTPAGEVPRFDAIAENQARLVGHDVLKDVPRPIAADLLRVIVQADGLQQAAGDVAARENAHQFAALVHHRQPPHLVPGELLHRLHHRLVGLHGDQASGHPCPKGRMDVAIFQRLDQVLYGDNAYQPTLFKYRCPRDAVDPENLFQFAHGRVGRHGDDPRCHHPRYGQFVDSFLYPRNLRNL